MRNRTGFSLVELMIVVAIIGILAAIAVPNYIAMQLKAKRSEMPANVNGIKTAEIAANSALDQYITTPSNPTGVPGKTLRAWSVDASWTQLGWRPDGPVRGSYAVTAGATDFTITASTDVDGDGVFSNYSASASINATILPGDTNVY